MEDTEEKKIKLKKTTLVYCTAVLSLWNTLCKKSYTIRTQFKREISNYEKIQEEDKNLKKKLELLDNDNTYKMIMEKIEYLKNNPYFDNPLNINDLIEDLKVKENNRKLYFESFNKLLEDNGGLYLYLNEQIEEYKKKN